MNQTSLCTVAILAGGQSRRMDTNKSFVQLDGKPIIEYNIDRLIRSLIPPFPGAFFFYNGKKIIVTESELLSVSYHGVPGRIAKLDKSGIVILAKDRGIKIKKIKVSNNKTIIASKYPFKAGTDVK